MTSLLGPPVFAALKGAARTLAAASTRLTARTSDGELYVNPQMAMYFHRGPHGPGTPSPPGSAVRSHTRLIALAKPQVEGFPVIGSGLARPKV
jgi:hypothetical protein